LGGVHPCDARTKLEETRAHYEGGFDLADHQLAFSLACGAFWASMKAQGVADPSRMGQPDGYACWMDEFQSWLAREKGRSFPVVPASDFRPLALEWRANLTSAGRGPSYADTTGFLEDGQRVYYAFASFNTTETIKDFYRGAINFDDLWATHDKMVTALAAAEAAGDGSVGGGGVQSLLFYPRMVSSRTFLESGVQNLIIGLVLAATVITLMTMNWKVALLSAASLVVIPLSLFMVLATARIKINIIESIALSLAAGMAVDYVLHLAHAFNHAKGSAEDKVRSCLAEMGISVTYGALTSFASCCALFTCDFLFFFKFGVLITIIVWSGFIISMTSMVASFALFGPGDASGVIPAPACLQRHAAQPGQRAGHISSPDPTVSGTPATTSMA